MRPDRRSHVESTADAVAIVIVVSARACADPRLTHAFVRSVGALPQIPHSSAGESERESADRRERVRKRDSVACGSRAMGGRDEGDDYASPLPCVSAVAGAKTQGEACVRSQRDVDAVRR